MSFNLREKVLICRELTTLCDIISIDISYRKNSVIYLIENNGLSRLSFITPECLIDKKSLISPLSREETRELSAFLYSLGKSDSKTQLMLVEGFKEYITLCGNEYRDKCEKNSRLYIALGLFAGVLTGFCFI